MHFKYRCVVATPPTTIKKQKTTITTTATTTTTTKNQDQRNTFVNLNEVRMMQNLAATTSAKTRVNIVEIIKAFLGYVLAIK